ncbi:hypothetical protein DFQ28_009384 [Apophysomyces sp. BC1034]|nr:hypothetical protein DFQ30_009106 [Apophysomyces sp. BC1015]KAG0173187.1 hypothetical protein DFQ29_008053 [Apophysomyces sp. BC1021]KAG0185414.1 hypothetical protein DFQ28_009384 [Apophysomyces sp. BC1034]
MKASSFIVAATVLSVGVSAAEYGRQPGPLKLDEIPVVPGSGIEFNTNPPVFVTTTVYRELPPTVYDPPNEFEDHPQYPHDLQKSHHYDPSHHYHQKEKGHKKSSKSYHGQSYDGSGGRHDGYSGSKHSKGKKNQHRKGLGSHYHRKGEQDSGYHRRKGKGDSDYHHHEGGDSGHHYGSSSHHYGSSSGHDHDDYYGGSSGGGGGSDYHADGDDGDQGIWSEDVKKEDAIEPFPAEPPAIKPFDIFGATASSTGSHSSKAAVASASSGFAPAMSTAALPTKAGVTSRAASMSANASRGAMSARPAVANANSGTNLQVGGFMTLCAAFAAWLLL